MRAIFAAASLVLTVVLAPTAAADTAVLPERPGAAGVMFTDNPAIVDGHPIQAESFSRVDNDHAIAVHFTTGTPQCYGVHATVAETAEDVTVDLRGGTLPEAVDRACIMIALTGTVELPLQSPLDDRTVISRF